MGLIDYKALEPVSGDLQSLSTKLTNIVDSCESFPDSVDPRIHEYYSDYFQGVFSSKGEISSDSTNMTTFSQWFEGLMAEGQATDAANAASIPTGGGDTGGDGTSSTTSAGDGAGKATHSTTTGTGTESTTTTGDGATKTTTTSTSGTGTESTTTTGDGATTTTTTSTSGTGTESTTTTGDGASTATTTTTGGDGTTKPQTSIGGALATSIGETSGSGAAGVTGAAAGAGVAGLTGLAGAAGAALAAGAGATDETKGATVKIGDGEGMDDLIESSLLGLDGASYSRLNKDFAQYGFSKEDWDKLSPEQQETIKAKLKELGYSDEEIENIINGNLKVLGCVEDALTTQLEQLLKSDPSLRQKLLEKYGMDIFNPDGTVDRSKLTLAMLMDDRDPRDGYSLINYLHDNYGIDLIDSTRFNSTMDKLLQAYKKNPKLRSLLKQKYGIDIFNADGTIDYERLTKLLLMDDVNPDDAYEINKFIEDYNKQNSILYGFKSFFGGGPLSILGGGVVLATSSILMYKMIKKSKNKPPVDTTGKYINDDDYYNISKEELELLGEELNPIEMKLIDVSYNIEEVDRFKDGQYSVLKCIIDEITSALEILHTDDKKIEKDLISIYDFNVFEKDFINTTKLAILLVIDFKDDLDRYDVISLLKDNYDIEVAIDKKLKEVTESLKDNGTKIVDDEGKEVIINESNMKNLLKKQYLDENEVS